MRPRRYDSNAQKQAAYRLRKKASAKFPVASLKAEERPLETLGDVESTPTPQAISVEKKDVGGFKLNMISISTETGREEPTVPVVKPKVFRDDFGNQLTEAQWDRWQEIKRKAEDAGYVKDEYSQ